MLETIHVETPGNEYTIHLGEGIVLHEKSDDLISMLKKRRWAIITDDQVLSLYPDVIETMPGEILARIAVPPGETTKSLSQVEKVLDQLVESGLTRRDGIIAIGGGVVGDLAGFCASVYMRGIPWVQIPTTLLSQVDSSVGGKTGVNLTRGKNLVGSFYQPLAVWIDPVFLKTLSESEYSSGCGEVIKYGIIEGLCLRQWLTEHWTQVSQRNPSTMLHLIKRCLECKAAIVAADEKESGVRKILNFGHTIGHGVEKCLDYQITHGEALRFGMLMELELACRLHWIFRNTCQELKAFVSLIPERELLRKISKESLIQAMTADKKNQDHRISFVLPREPRGLDEIQLSPDELSRLLD